MGLPFLGRALHADGRDGGSDGGELRSAAGREHGRGEPFLEHEDGAKVHAVVVAVAEVVGGGGRGDGAGGEFWGGVVVCAGGAGRG